MDIKIYDWEEVITSLTSDGYEVVIHQSGDAYCDLSEEESKEWFDFLEIALPYEHLPAMITSEYIIIKCGSKEESDDVCEIIDDWSCFYSLWLDGKMISHK